MVIKFYYLSIFSYICIVKANNKLYCAIVNTEFRTIIEPPKFNLKIDHSQRVLFVGSCFAENIAQYMLKAKFNTTCNPFGVLYNPASIANMFETLQQKRTFFESDLTPAKDNSLWCSFSFHGSFSDQDPYTALTKMNDAVMIGADSLLRSDVVIITFGTAWIYQLLEGEQTVANCHKFSSSIFNRKLLSVEEIVETYDKIVSQTLKDKEVIFTVSPIRHIKDGLSENTISKATLHLAIKELTHKHQNASYFPSYEIMLDDLRDYRFYAEDMVHPSKLAVDYIWNIFSDSLFSDKTKNLVKDVEKIADAMNHRPFNPNSTAHLKFKDSIFSRTLKLQETYPQMDMSRELAYFKTNE